MKAAEATSLNNLGLLFASALAFLSIILSGGSLHIAHINRQWNWPLIEGWKSAPDLTPALAMACIAACAVLLIREWRKASLASLKNWLNWISLPLLLATGIWLVQPADNAGSALWMLFVVVLVGALWLSARSLKALPAPGIRYVLARRDVFADSLIVLLPVIIGACVVGGGRLDPEPFEVVYSALIYPVYALAQLFVFLVIPATHMSNRGYSSNTIAVSCALIFGLIHWPNPLLMAGTGLAMLVWAKQFLRGRNVLMLALVLAIGATGFKYAMPQQWGWEMRIGPDYVAKRAAYDAGLKTRQELPGAN